MSTAAVRNDEIRTKCTGNFLKHSRFLLYPFPVEHSVVIRRKMLSGSLFFNFNVFDFFRDGLVYFEIYSKKNKKFKKL